MVLIRRDEGNWRAYFKVTLGGFLVGALLLANRRQPQSNVIDNAGRANNDGAETDKSNPLSANQRGWHTEERTHRKRERGYWNWSLVFSAVAMGGAIAAAIFTGSSVRAGWKAVKLSHQAIVEENRAWVGTSAATISGPILATKPITGVVSYQNFGKEPATNMGASADIAVISLKQWNFLGKNGGVDQEQRWEAHCLGLVPPDQAMVIFPSQGSNNSDNLNWSVTEANFSSVPDKTLFADLANGKEVLMVQLCLVYRTFGIVKHTYSCYYYLAGQSTSGFMSICATAYAD